MTLQHHEIQTWAVTLAVKPSKCLFRSVISRVANARIQSEDAKFRLFWIPARAGMTKFGVFCPDQFGTRSKPAFATLETLRGRLTTSPGKIERLCCLYRVVSIGINFRMARARWLMARLTTAGSMPNV